MKTLALLRHLGPVDAKNALRDPLLRYLLPQLAELLWQQAAFDLTAYYPLVMSGFLLQAPSLVGMVVGFLLLDERDEQILVALLAAPVAPQITLLLVGFAANKVAGFALIKSLNAVLLIPIAAYFLPAAWQWAAAAVPTFWPLKAFWLAAAGQPYAALLAAGLAYNLVVLGWLARRLGQMLHAGG